MHLANSQMPFPFRSYTYFNCPLASAQSFHLSAGCLRQHLDQHLFPFQVDDLGTMGGHLQPGDGGARMEEPGHVWMPSYLVHSAFRGKFPACPNFGRWIRSGPSTFYFSSSSRIWPWWTWSRVSSSRGWWNTRGKTTGLGSSVWSRKLLSWRPSMTSSNRNCQRFGRTIPPWPRRALRSCCQFLCWSSPWCGKGCDTYTRCHLRWLFMFGWQKNGVACFFYLPGTPGHQFDCLKFGTPTVWRLSFWYTLLQLYHRSSFKDWWNKPDNQQKP